MSKISELPAADLPLVGDETVPVVQGGETKGAPVSEFGGGSGGYVDWDATPTFDIPALASIDGATYDPLTARMTVSNTPLVGNVGILSGGAAIFDETFPLRDPTSSAINHIANSLSATADGWIALAGFCDANAAPADIFQLLENAFAGVNAAPANCQYAFASGGGDLGGIDRTAFYAYWDGLDLANSSSSLGSPTIAGYEGTMCILANNDTLNGFGVFISEVVNGAQGEATSNIDFDPVIETLGNVRPFVIFATANLGASVHDPEGSSVDVGFVLPYVTLVPTAELSQPTIDQFITEPLSGLGTFAPPNIPEGDFLRTSTPIEYPAYGTVIYDGAYYGNNGDNTLTVLDNEQVDALVADNASQIEINQALIQANANAINQNELDITNHESRIVVLENEVADLPAPGSIGFATDFNLYTMALNEEREYMLGADFTFDGNASGAHLQRIIDDPLNPPDFLGEASVFQPEVNNYTFRYSSSQVSPTPSRRYVVELDGRAYNASDTLLFGPIKQTYYIRHNGSGGVSTPLILTSIIPQEGGGLDVWQLANRQVGSFNSCYLGIGFSYGRGFGAGGSGTSWPLGSLVYIRTRCKITRLA